MVTHVVETVSKISEDMMKSKSHSKVSDNRQCPCLDIPLYRHYNTKSYKKVENKH